MDSERNKVVHDIDLNYPPVYCQGGNLTSWNDVVSAATSSAVNPHPLPDVGSYCSPIIVDADKDEMLSLSIAFPQMRNQSTRSQSMRSQPLTIALDEDMEINPRQSANVMEDPITTLTLFTFNKHEIVPPNTTITNHDHYQDTEACRSPKRRNVTKPTQEPVKVVPMNEELTEKHDVEPVNKPNEEPAKKFPTVTCPICWNPVVEASSTICGHVFCHGCIKQAIRVYKRCPTCRKELTMRKVHRIFLP